VKIFVLANSFVFEGGAFSFSLRILREVYPSFGFDFDCFFVCVSFILF
jgi:hypothetical protein